MKCFRWERFGALEGLVPHTVEAPQPGPREVLLRVRASSLNQRDLMVARGIPVGAPLVPGLVPLSDGAGEIVETGEGVDRFRKGDRVAAIFRQAWFEGDMRPEQVGGDLGGGRDGMLTELIVLDQEGLVRLPEHLSFEEGATLPCAAVTAWNAVIERGGAKPGDTVLVQGSGGVALFALQFAKLAGARVIATTSSAQKAERLRLLGADEVIDYCAHTDWDAEVLRVTQGAGVDLVVEIGGPGTLARSLACTRFGGKVVLVGLLTGAQADAGPIFMTAFLREITITSVHVGSRRMFKAMNRAIEQARLRPVIDRLFPFFEAVEAYRHLRSAGHFGKVVIVHN